MYAYFLGNRIVISLLKFQKPKLAMIFFILVKHRVIKSKYIFRKPELFDDIANLKLDEFEAHLG